ncbi:MAG TPA: CoA transferase [Syntrophales bacterium]|nr:CoA transferase [Syntrophales bacterium]
MNKALEGIKVLDLSRFFTGPTCTMMMAELGAEIIKVEIPDGGDAMRHLWPLTEGGESYVGVILNRGKKSVTLNLKNEEGREILKKLVKEVDVLIENFATGVMDRLGLSYEDLQKINPSLIYTSITGFGHTGPDSKRVAYDMLAQARGGIMSVTGFKDGPPIKPGPAVADYLGGVHALIAILAALRYRDATGKGQAIDLSLLEAIWMLTSMEHCGYYFLYGKAYERRGNEALANAPSGCYPTNDGWVVMNIPTDAEWARLCQAMHREDLITDPMYSTISLRVENRDEVNERVSEWTRGLSMKEVEDELIKARVACSQVPTFDQVPNDPQLLSRDMVVEIEQKLSGKMKVPGSVFKMSETPGNGSMPAPFVGEHNHEIYSKLLGCSEKEVDELKAKGVI